MNRISRTNPHITWERGDYFRIAFTGIDTHIITTADNVLDAIQTLAALIADAAENEADAFLDGAQAGLDEGIKMGRAFEREVRNRELAGSAATS